VNQELAAAIRRLTGVTEQALPDWEARYQAGPWPSPVTRLGEAGQWLPYGVDARVEPERPGGWLRRKVQLPARHHEFEVAGAPVSLALAGWGYTEVWLAADRPGWKWRLAQPIAGDDGWAEVVLAERLEPDAVFRVAVLVLQCPAGDPLQWQGWGLRFACLHFGALAELRELVDQLAEALLEAAEAGEGGEARALHAVELLNWAAVQRGNAAAFRRSVVAADAALH
jgi:hypothetical protein